MHRRFGTWTEMSSAGTMVAAMLNRLRNRPVTLNIPSVFYPPGNEPTAALTHEANALQRKSNS